MGELLPNRDIRFVFSDDRKHRLLLERRWAKGKRTLLWIGHNPSTADENTDDPTLRRMVKFSFDDYDALLVANLFTVRSPDPLDVAKSRKRNEDGADDFIIGAVRESSDVLCCWGNVRCEPERAVRVLELLAASGKRLFCLGRTRAGYPRHPLYVPQKQRFEPFDPKAPIYPEDGAAADEL